MALTYLALNVAIGGIILYALRVFMNSLAWSKKYKLPPRIPGIPVFGNTFQIPPIQQGPWAKDLADKHGEM